MLVVYGAIVALALAVSVVATALLLRRQRATLEAYALEIATLHGSVQQHVAAYGRVTAVLQSLVASSEGLDSRLERLELRGGEPSYGRAIALVQRGADADSLVRDFGLSKAEAELVSVVHARRAVG
jgi:hypothetical protein